MTLSFEVDSELLNRKTISITEFGSYTIMINTPKIAKTLSAHYGRRGLALKVFKGMTDYRTMTAKSIQQRYGKVSIENASIIQNLFASEGISPRVYDIVYVNDILAQVTDYIPRERDPVQEAHELRITVLKGLMDKYKIVFLSKSLDLGMSNWRANKFVDFSHLDFEDFEAYKKELDIRARTRRGKLLSKAYQPVPELEIIGTRDIKTRIENLKLSSVEFSRKTVLDIGCNLGIFSRYALDAGARRVIGIDKIGQLAFEINNVLGYWNLDIVTDNILKYLEQKIKIKTFRLDIVFLMAVQNYLGGIERTLTVVRPFVKELLIVESHGGEPKELYEEVFKLFNFTKIEYLGYVQDPQVRHQWRCYTK
jgi:hypothetical protein